MQCPVCTDKTLVMSERQGIEIDYCPGCRGVWLDRGELDKIIERAGSDQAPVAQAAPQPAQQHSAPSPSYPPQAQPRHPGDYHAQQHYQHKRRKSFFEELFD